MDALLVPVVIVVILLIAGAIALARFAARQRDRADRMGTGHQGVVRYRVPPGQDPTVVILELGHAGFEAVADPADGLGNELTIARAGHNRMDREKLRAAIADITQLNLEGDPMPAPLPVRFEDE